MKKCIRTVALTVLCAEVLIFCAAGSFADGPIVNQIRGSGTASYSNIQLELYPFFGTLRNCTQIPFYYASATSELKEGDILFTAAYAMDESVNRPWVEGVRGAGSGESLTLSFNRAKTIDVLSLRLGYARNSDLYYYNNRPRTIRFEFSDGSWGDYVFGDVNQEQIIQLSRSVETSYVKLTILDVYAGDCNDTCIYLVKAYQASSNPRNAKPLELFPFNDPYHTYYQVPFYYATATSELKEGDILFTAAYAIDESVNRPWVEGVRGAGSGESLTLYFSGTESIDVLSLRLGYARDSRLYYANNRPKTIRFEFSDGSTADYLFGDINQEQIVQLSRTVETSYVKMTIIDVYSGDCNDTCIYLVKAYCA